MTHTRTHKRQHEGEDLERNDGSVERPYFMSATLHDILWENKAPETGDQEASLPLRSSSQEVQVPLQLQEGEKKKEEEDTG